MTPPCTTDPDLWHPQTAAGWDARSGPVVDKAKRVCRECPLRTGCLRIGLTDPHGIWGGLTPHERSGLIATLGLRRRRAVSASVDWVMVQRLIAGEPCTVPPDMRDDTIRALRAAGMRSAWIGRAVGVPYTAVRDVLGLAA